MKFPKGLLNALLLQLLLLQISTSLDTISFDQSIKDGEFLVSKNETFVLGFFSPGTSSNRYVGIWYKFSDAMVVWVANRDNPLWSTSVSVSSSSKNTIAAQLLDSGNFVLVQQESQNFLWQSSDHPTHILLASMKIGLDKKRGINRYITSWNSNNDPGTGNCSLRMEPNGSPQLILYKNEAKWWRSGQWNGIQWGGIPGMTPNNVFSIIFVNNQDEVTVTWKVLDPSIFSVITVDGSGQIQQLVWQGQQQGWVAVWSDPMDACDSYGKCGPFGNCDPYTVSGFNCTCFPGYEPNSPQDWDIRDGSGGCKRQEGSISMCRNGEGFVKMDHVKVPDTSFFDLSTIVEATEEFSSANMLGHGGFGIVYKGSLPDGQEIAVKRLSRNSGQGVEEFKNEVKLIAKLQHRNLVRLFGCCIDKEERMLIYEYMPNRSLDLFIFDKNKRSLLDWGKRFQIIIGISRGVLYLHQDSRLKIIHRDLKASNVLLDLSMNPKISDFGMARMFGDDQIEANTNRVVGTYGYMSPEYAMDGLYSTKSDVFSFGVLALEIICGKKNNFQFEDSYLNLVGQIWDLWIEGKALDMVDSSLGQSYPTHEVMRCIQIGLLCVQENAIDRPTMLDVVFMLGNETTLLRPKKAAFSFKNSAPDSSTSRGASSVNDVTVTVIEAR